MHDVVVEVATELALLGKVWCMHPVRWRRNWYRDEQEEGNGKKEEGAARGATPNRETPAHLAQKVQQPGARGRKTHVELEQIQVLEKSYPSQKYAWSWLIDLETVFLPYAEHVANNT